MQSVRPIHVTFRRLSSSGELTERVECEADHLMMHHPPITTLRVALALPHRSRRKGTSFLVRVELVVPGRTLVARGRHEDPRGAIHEAFAAAERALRSYRGRRRTTRTRIWSPRVRDDVLASVPDDQFEEAALTVGARDR